MEIQLSNHGLSWIGVYIEKIMIINSCDPYILTNDPSALWTNNLDKLSEVTYPVIFNYLVLTKSAYILEEFKAFKSLEAYNFFVSRWISNTRWISINNVVLVIAELYMY